MNNPMGRPTMRRSSCLLAAAAVAALALTPGYADARAGSGSSFGSRGGRSYSAPPSTNTSPYTAAPLERSITPRPAPGFGTQAPYGGYGAAPARSGFGSGLLGGLLGVGLGGLLLGHGFFGGGGGGGLGFIGFVLQLVILFFIARWVMRLIFGRARQPAFAGMPRMGQPASAGGPMPGGGGARPQPSVAITPNDYAAFEQVLQHVQSAWSAQDTKALQQVATPEMVGYFGEQLAAQASRGVRNTVTQVRLEQGDLAEAWGESGREYATVAMRFSMLDVTVDGTGRVVDGDPNTRTIATELWTFVRAPGGRWLLSAIQQGR